VLLPPRPPNESLPPVPPPMKYSDELQALNDRTPSVSKHAITQTLLPSQ
jgi:hypothetical protein